MQKVRLVRMLYDLKFGRLAIYNDTFHLSDNTQTRNITIVTEHAFS